jgi:hypothetical protein
VAKVKPVIVPAAPACSPTQAQYDAAIAQLHSAYEDHLNQTMAHLHNRFVAFIGESRLPIPQVLLVLGILTSETIEQAKKKYGV